jgi:uncharacterized protein YceH (UPF0502 family)
MELLDAAEVRVLGALIEKEATTPEYYPLSLNALLNACNQKSNRDPVVEFDGDVVTDAIEGLRQKGLALIVKGSGRVVKYGQRMSETMNMGRREMAILCTLLLRGPQTLGEIKDRSDRLYTFADLGETEIVLEKLSEWPSGGPLSNPLTTGPELSAPPPASQHASGPCALVKKLPRQPGQKEARYAHLLAGEPAVSETALDQSAPAAPSRITQLESEVAQLRDEFNQLKNRFEALEAQLR